jgi:hypothetical protein
MPKTREALFRRPSRMPAATRRAVRCATNLLTATPDEAALIIACALNDPRDLLRLARACRRFAIKCIGAPAAHSTTTRVVFFCLGGVFAATRFPGVPSTSNLFA